MLDVDDTTLTTWNYELFSNWDFNPVTNGNFVGLTNGVFTGNLFPATPGMLASCPARESARLCGLLPDRARRCAARGDDRQPRE